MTTKNDGLETGARSNSPEVTIAFVGAEPRLSDRDDRWSRPRAASMVLERGGLRLRGKLRDGAGNPWHLLGTARHLHSNLHRHVAAARHILNSHSRSDQHEAFSAATTAQLEQLGICHEGPTTRSNPVKQGHQSIDAERAREGEERQGRHREARRGTVLLEQNQQVQK